MENIRVIFCGDVFGRPGRRAVKHILPVLKEKYSVHLTMANCENAAGGLGVTPVVADELFQSGIDVLTSGNHIWKNKEIYRYLEKSKNLLRPANYPEDAPGRGFSVFTTQSGTKVGILNLEGRAFMSNLECPFRVAERVIGTLKDEVNALIVDFHAETTSEKNALGAYLDGKVSAILGSHTHVQTADERISGAGTAYITDAGMTGPFDSIIGLKKEPVIRRFITQRPIPFKVAKGDVKLQGVFLEIDGSDGKAVKIERIKIDLDESLVKGQGIHTRRNF